MVQTYNDPDTTYEESGVEYNGTEPVVTLHHPMEVTTAKVDSVDDETCDGDAHSKPLEHSADLNDPAGGNAEEGDDVIFRASSNFGTVTGQVTASGGDACVGTSLGGETFEFDVYNNNTKVGRVIYRHVEAPPGGYPSGEIAVGAVVGIVSDEYTSAGCYDLAHIHMDWAAEGTSTVDVECPADPNDPRPTLGTSDTLGTLTV